MFTVSQTDINAILDDFKIPSKASSFTELQRYYYEKSNPESKEVRLIVRANLENGSSVVIRFKNENDVTQELIEEQSRFAELLRTNGIPTPMQYKTGGCFSKWYQINAYHVLVTVEEFVEGELKCVTAELAEQTGQLLARSHNLAEQYDCHVKNPVLFNPFTENDLFRFGEFKSVEKYLSGDNLRLYEKIIGKYDEYMQLLLPLQDEPRYAVQGDISNCNLYQLADGGLGVFDFNRCGDNYLYCDAVMQAVFEARLMEYPAEYSSENEDRLLRAFLRGYQSERPFSDLQQTLFPYLHAIIDAFWAQDIVWGDNSLVEQCESGDEAAIHGRLEAIWERLLCIRKKHYK